MKIQKMRTILDRSALVLAVALAVASGSKANAELVYGVSDQLGQLVSFDSATPGTLLSAVSITGMQSGEQMRGIDWIGGTLYGLGDQNHLYTINPATGAAAQVGAAFSPVLNGIDYGFNAGTSQLYVSSDLGQNLTINPITGVATVGPNYTGASLDSLAYDYFSSDFYGISSASHDLYLVNPATGATTLIGPAGVGFVDRIGFDISPLSNDAFFSGTVAGQTEFFDVNLATGALTLIGDVGTPGELSSGLDSIAIVETPEPATIALVAIGGFMLVSLRRKK